jgi:hypothetical protein
VNTREFKRRASAWQQRLQHERVKISLPKVYDFGINLSRKENESSKRRNTWITASCKALCSCCLAIDSAKAKDIFSTARILLDVPYLKGGLDANKISGVGTNFGLRAQRAKKLTLDYLT